MKQQNCELLRGMIQRLGTSETLDLLAKHHSELRRSADSAPSLFDMCITTVYKEVIQNITLEQQHNHLMNLIERSIILEQQHKAHSQHLTGLITARQDFIQSTLETLDTLKTHTDEADEANKQKLLLELHREKCTKLEPSLELFRSESKIFGFDKDFEVDFGATKMPLYPKMLTINEKYQALCKVFDGGMAPDLLVKLTFCSPYWQGTHLKFYHQNFVDNINVNNPIPSSELQIAKISERVSKMAEENISLQQECANVHKTQIELLRQDFFGTDVA